MDYVIINRAIYPNEILDDIILSSESVGSDYQLVPAKVRELIKTKQQVQTISFRKQYNIELLE